MKLETTKEIGKCLCLQLEFISLVLELALLISHLLTGNYLCLELIEYRKISNSFIHVVGKEYKIC